MSDKDINNLRKQIDDIDYEILKLLDKRANLALALRKLKLESSIPQYNPERELLILSSLLENYNGILPKNSINIIFREIISACRNVNSDISVLVLGEPYSISHDVSVKLLGNSITFKALDSANEIISLLKKNQSTIAVFPLLKYNSEINLLLDSLFYNEFYIIYSYFYFTKFSIISAYSDDITTIDKIYATRESLNLVKFYSLPISFNGEIKICYSNQEVVENLVETLPNAGLLPANLSRSLNLKAIYSDIEPPNNTYIKFLAISGRDVSNFIIESSMKQTYVYNYNKVNSVILATKNNFSVIEIMKIFEKTNSLVTSIETYPISNKAYDKIWLIDFDFEQKDQKAYTKKLSEMKELFDERKLIYKILNRYLCINEK